MQLTVPHRTEANANSFPIDPEGVSVWMKNLRPLEVEADAREIYRGLKHSNRLHNKVDTRREILNCFIPILRQLHVQLSEINHAQPLPLSREFHKSARLCEALLREEAFGFKLLLYDNPKPLAHDARRAMQALAKHVEILVNGYQKIPASLLNDAHQLYALAEEHRLLSNRQGSDLLTLQDHYRFILLVSISDLNQHRARQLPLVLDFLKLCSSEIHIEKNRDTQELSALDYAINIKLGSLPAPALAVLTPSPSEIRWFSVAPVLYKIDKYSSRLRSSTTKLLGSDTLERQSLARIHVALSRTRKRRSARRVTSLKRRIVFGHKEICAHLLYQTAKPSFEERTDWTVINMSAQGMCIYNPHCRPGLVQVGELISITDPAKPVKQTHSSQSSKVDALIGVVRWIRCTSEQGVTLGAELLARSTLPVRVLRDSVSFQVKNGKDSALAIHQDDISQDVGVGENALIVACKIQQSVLQTILLPAYLFETGDQLTAVQGGRSRRVKLRKCLQANGLFSQYSLVDASNSAS